MELYPAVTIHGLAEAVAVLATAAEGRPQARGVTLLSAPGAALYAGCGWWRALVEQARAAHPNVPCIDILDCADATGQALAALRIGVSRLVLWPEAPGREAVVAIAESMGGFVLAAPPAASALTITRAIRGATPTACPNATEPNRGLENRDPTEHGMGNGDKPRMPG
jgi:hypothetical protein